MNESRDGRENELIGGEWLALAILAMMTILRGSFQTLARGGHNKRFYLLSDVPNQAEHSYTSGDRI